MGVINANYKDVKPPSKKTVLTVIGGIVAGIGALVFFGGRKKR